MACNTKLSKDILLDCADLPKQGVENSGSAILINFEDINRTSTTNAGATVTDLVLVDGATGYKLDYYKQLAQGAGAYTPNAEAIDGFSHSGILRLPTQGAESAERAAELKGGLYVVVLKTKYQGVEQKDAYKVFGFENGMALSELTTNTNENSGSLLFTLTTEEHAYETYPYNIFLEGDYATSTATFDALFASV
jgi:hypothetical protein